MTAGPAQITTVPESALVPAHVFDPVLTGAKAVSKRIVEGSLAFVMVVLFAPLMLLIAVGIKMDSPGPVLFRQRRIGLGGQPFNIFKFRSMRQGAEQQLEAVVGGEVRPYCKPANDPRITAFGSFIRKTSLDELPQIFNILNGTMSLVGPRPQTPKEVACYTKRQLRRLDVRPGITGAWQVSGRSNLTGEQALEIDVDYVENHSFIGDVKILARTLPVVLARRGAV